MNVKCELNENRQWLGKCINNEPYYDCYKGDLQTNTINVDLLKAIRYFNWLTFANKIKASAN